MGLGIVVLVDGLPEDELAQASQVEVHERMGELTTFRLRYPVDVRAGDLPLLVDDRLGPGAEIRLLAGPGPLLDCLVSGPVHGQQVHLVHGGAGSWVEVAGSDSSTAMDRETRTAVWADVTDSQAVTTILAGYGYVPDVAATDAGHFESKHSLVQRDTDLRFVRRLARRNGCLFWVTCDALGAETAHFRRPPLEGEAAAQLTLNVEPATLGALDIIWDVERPTSVVGQQLDLNTKQSLDGAVAASAQTVLGARNLAAVAGAARSVHLHAPADDAGDLRARGEGTLIEAGWFITATCQTSLHATEKLIRAHTVVELQGAGSRFSGKYFVAGVRHLIDATAHKMDLTLVRNGWS